MKLQDVSLTRPNITEALTSAAHEYSVAVKSYSSALRLWSESSRQNTVSDVKRQTVASK